MNSKPDYNKHRPGHHCLHLTITILKLACTYTMPFISKNVISLLRLFF